MASLVSDVELYESTAASQDTARLRICCFVATCALLAVHMTVALIMTAGASMSGFDTHAGFLQVGTITQGQFSVHRI